MEAFLHINDINFQIFSILYSVKTLGNSRPEGFASRTNLLDKSLTNELFGPRAFVEEYREYHG